MNQKRRPAKRERRPGSKAAQQAKRKQQLIMRLVLVGLAFLLFLVILIAVLLRRSNYEINKQADTLEEALEPDFEVDLLTVNANSRPGIALNEVNAIVIHYTANPGSTAKDNRDYFEGLQNGSTTYASSHFVIGLDGEVIQCIPTSEISYASNDRNGDTLAIECCHPDESGEFTKETYHSLVQTTAWLCAKFDLDADSVIRHYDVTGKECPLYFVENEDAWEDFLRDVDDLIEEGEKAVQ